MAEPTTTRAALRRAIGKQVRQEFFLRYGGAGYINPTTISTDNLEIAATDSLRQGDKEWNGYWLYNASASEERLVTDFVASSHTLYVEWPFTTNLDTASELELWGIWPPSMVNDAINRSILDVWKMFPRVITNERMVVQEDVTRYPLSSDDLNPFTADTYPNVGSILQVWIENSRNSVTGIVGSADTVSLTDSDLSPDTDADTDWFVSIYSGTGAGQLREVASVSSDSKVTIGQAWTTNPDTTSEYTLWDTAKGEQEDDWFPLTSFRTDREEFPDTLYLTSLYPGAHGLRLRMVYLGADVSMTADTDATAVPSEYLIYKAVSILYDSLVSDNQLDRGSNAGIAEYYDQLAEREARKFRRSKPPRTIRSERDSRVHGSRSYDGNPLDWEGQG